MMTELTLATILFDGAVAYRKQCERALDPHKEQLLHARLFAVYYNSKVNDYLSPTARTIRAELVEAMRIERNARFRVSAAQEN